MPLSPERIKEARKILADNDLDGYTIPCQRLYPFQWNWDSVITALGWATIDPERAWLEIENLMKGQWENGMIPHIVFHRPSADYFPGPKYWGVGRAPPTSSISQPPILAEGCRLLWQHAKGDRRQLAENKIKELFPQLCDYYLWWFRERTGEHTGIKDLPVSLHPWESGMDNSPAWDEALAAVPAVNMQFTRKDTTIVHSKQRPHDDEYKRYLELVRFFKEANFVKDKMLRSPYRVHDIGILSLLYKSGRALCDMASAADMADDSRIREIKERQERLRVAAGKLWADGHFRNYDAVKCRFIKAETSAGFLSLYGELATRQQAEAMRRTIQKWMESCPYGIPSVDPAAPYFESERYWRGPTWLHINWMIAEGLKKYGDEETAGNLRTACIRLTNENGFAEYYDPVRGTACGGPDFSWTAAVALFWLTD